LGHSPRSGVSTRADLNLHLEDRAVNLEKYGTAAEKITLMLQCTRLWRGKIDREKYLGFVWKLKKMRGDRVLKNIRI
jgi:hypothetical protein